MPIVDEIGFVVIDASAVVAMLIDPGDRGSQVSEEVRYRQMVAPPLLPFGVWNALRWRRNGGWLTSEEADLARHDFAALPIQLWPSSVLEDRIWALGPNLSSYDAGYVALAEAIDAPLLTCDARSSRAPGVKCEFLVVS